eukprot:jgi/Mesvir1/26869/Mv20611-RA.1
MISGDICLAGIPPDATFEAVIIGNGRSLVNSNLGSTIDKYKEVVRFNFFTTAGYESHIGTKTTIWFVNLLRDPKGRPHTGGADSARQIVVPIVFRAGCTEKKWNCPPADSSKARKRAQRVSEIMEQYKRERLDHKLFVGSLEREEALLYGKLGFKAKFPSTGLLAVAYMALRHKQVAIAGFDFAKGVHEHYFETKTKTSTVHAMAEETAVIQKLIAKGQVYRLD